ncbi:MAG: sigma 54-interacting transcriptional regulator [Vicinamibacterales bacterium]|nr:sigma 54-interacting transcriptional regulator [Vicinamibacterales bacterium]
MAPRDGTMSPRDPRKVYIEVPVPLGGGPATLEIESHDWSAMRAPDAALLESAAVIAGLILAVDRPRAVIGVAKHSASGPVRIVGDSSPMERLRQRVDRIAGSDVAVLVEGETGSGKELVARRIHERSGRRSGPFIPVNCAALVETLVEAELFGIEDRTATGVRGRKGKFEHANGGTLFLDEVADLSPTAQAKLLRAIQESSVERVGGAAVRQIDTRIVAATNRRLAQMVTEGQFRADLFYRLNGVEVEVPPLRARLGDLGALVRHVLAERVGADFKIAASALEAMRTYDWPGNVRELEQVVVRAAALARGRELVVDDLPARVRQAHSEVLWPSLTAQDTMRAWGSRYAALVLERCHNNKRRACKWLDISYHTLQAYLRYDLRRTAVEGSRKPTDSSESAGAARHG